MSTAHRRMMLGAAGNQEGPGGELESIAHWTYDIEDLVWADVGTELKDSSGNAHHGENFLINDTKVIRPGVVGDQALKFDWPNTRYFSVPASADFEMSGDFTISLWTRTTGTNSTILCMSGRYDEAHYQIKSQSTGFAVFQIHDSVNSDIFATGTTNIKDGSWHHVLAERDGDIIRIFVDNSLEGSTDVTGYGTVGTATKAFLIGAAINLSGVIGGGYDGDMDDLWVFDGLLTAAEKTQLFERGN